MQDVKVESIVKDYKVGEVTVRALNSISLVIKKGSFISVAGPSGSGKTTLLNIIGCLDKPTSGDIFFDGENISGYNDNRLTYFRNQNIGFVFQDFNLIPVLTVYENVEFSLAINPKFKTNHKKLVEEILDMVGILELKNRFPKELSGGQKQRVAIARALVKKPILVLADEPTANLDSENAKNVMEIMKKMNRDLNTTFLFSTHDKLVMDYADDVIYLRDGKIVEKV
ncbi:MAG: ABC transporter ATP-binding protein [bacterium]|uniref:ABC transporter related protein n=2 Tax=Bacteria candidate phyla TaxID=1783234 RepID=A0A101I0Z6_UNCT6|nr:MAG: ABC transporter related protein [candidate division TA06 bacterium 32_111]KUK86633.1 MAG: ABC transporter related protein [candidate division TA06 bacterium 34_109]MDI6699883.1 ABC transporter ATP-binding protein [bacterium]HAF07729.1 lipoprotein-releasing system ATP-binding protein LolD [candidate division WOR-3 bacterium]HCP17192.1 lipoprotein-releasing system ATP-binding protein LolD [candidate division WOR-3 bacterium]